MSHRTFHATGFKPLWLLAFLFLTLSARIDSKELGIDYAKSSISYSIRHLMLSTEKGKFDSFTGSVKRDEKSGLFTHMRAEVDVRSINSGLELRNSYLRGEGMFDAKRHPYLRFDMTKYEGSASEGTLYGMLSIKGRSREVKLRLRSTGEEPDHSLARTFLITGFINRKEYGIGLDVGEALLAERVDLEIRLVLE